MQWNSFDLLTWIFIGRLIQGDFALASSMKENENEERGFAGLWTRTLDSACCLCTNYFTFVHYVFAKNKTFKALENSAEVVTYRKTFYGWGYNKFILRLSCCVVVGLYRCVVVYLCPCLFVRLCGCRVYWLSGCRLCCMVAW